MRNVKKLMMSMFLAGTLFLGCAMQGHAAQPNVEISETSVELGNSQMVTVRFEDGQLIENAVLTYRHVETGELYEQSAREPEGETAVFQLFFPGDAHTGEYSLEAISYQCTASAEKIVEVIPEGMNFFVCSEAQAEKITVEVSTSDENVKQGLSWKADGAASVNSKRQIVIVLDPGHDNSHAGAHQNGLYEEKLNLKIALYCREALEKYPGVDVHMTRDESGECPYPGRTAARCNEKRVEYAESIDADIYVSLHNNSSTSSSPKGAIVYYPNTNYSKSISDEGKGLARKIQDALVALGLYNNGISMKYSADYKYPDGSTADYYAIIRNSKLAGIPAIIVEHAFMSNSSDAKNFLSSDAKLKALGEADAKAIAEYYGLSTGTKKDGFQMEAKQRPYPVAAQSGKTAAGQIISTVTKAQVVQSLYDLEGKPEVNERKACAELRDIEEDWYTDAVCWAYEANIITGDLNTREFSPHANVTREQLAVMMFRYAVHKEYTMEQTESSLVIENEDFISSWALDAVKWAMEMNLFDEAEVSASEMVCNGEEWNPQGVVGGQELEAIFTRF